MNNDDERLLLAVESVCNLAAANFPRSTDVRIVADGPASGSIYIPSHLMLQMIKEFRTVKRTASEER